MLFFRVKEILHLNKCLLSLSIFRLSSTNELKRKTNSIRKHSSRSIWNLVSFPSQTITPKPTHFLIDRQLEVILHFRGCITSPSQCWLYCFHSLLTDPNCRNPNWWCAKPQGLSSQQKMPRTTMPQSNYFGCSDLARDSSVLTCQPLCYMICCISFKQKASRNMVF